MKKLAILTIAFCITTTICQACVTVDPNGGTYTVDSRGNVEQ